MDQRDVVVIVADTKLFPAIDTIYFFPQSFVGWRIKIEAADMIPSGDGMGIGLCNCAEPLTKH